jgi:hypothetical protein
MAAGNSFKIITPRNFVSWSLGARSIAGGFLGAGAPLWHLANEHIFAETQRYVHVITGDLKESGREEVHLEGLRVVATVSYGGGDVDYAEYEFARGGTHDALARGWEASQGTFQDTFGKTWNRVTQTWDVA